jgi:hypothetical protein
MKRIDNWGETMEHLMYWQHAVNIKEELRWVYSYLEFMYIDFLKMKIRKEQQ